MSTKNSTAPKTKASDIFVLAILSYLLLLVSPLFESFLSGNNWIATVILRVLCIAIWGACALGIVHTARKECSFNLINVKEKPSVLQWILAAAVTVAFAAYCIWDDHASIPSMIEAIDYVNVITYYAVMVAQSVIITLVIALGQKFGDMAVGKGKYIPYGGIILGLCWGIANIFSNLSYISEGLVDFPDVLVSALIMLAYGLVFGVIYLLIGKKTVYSLPLIAVAFVLM